MFKIYQCPYKMVCNPIIRRIIPYFFDYSTSSVWPDGSRIKASWLLVEAFEILLSVKIQEDKKGIKENGE